MARGWSRREGLLGRELARLTRHGLHRGVLGGSRVWTLIGAGAVFVRVVRWFADDRTASLARLRLRPGDAFEIRAFPPRARRR
jgi:hypothetical protein